MKKFILTILLLFIFINKAQGEDNILRYSDLSKNEILLSNENYLVVANVENDLYSIKYFTAKYCSNKHNNSYTSKIIQIGPNIAYAYCLMNDELIKYNLSNQERKCFDFYDQSQDYMFQRECNDITKNFELISSEVSEYRKKIDILDSSAFIYEIINEGVAKKISEFETKSLLPIIEQNINVRDLSLLDSIILNRNTKLCKSYGFLEESIDYSNCIMQLLINHNFIGNGFSANIILNPPRK